MKWEFRNRTHGPRSLKCELLFPLSDFNRYIKDQWFSPADIGLPIHGFSSLVSFKGLAYNRGLTLVAAEIEWPEVGKFSPMNFLAGFKGKVKLFGDGEFFDNEEDKKLYEARAKCAEPFVFERLVGPIEVRFDPIATKDRETFESVFLDKWLKPKNLKIDTGYIGSIGYPPRGVVKDMWIDWKGVSVESLVRFLPKCEGRIKLFGDGSMFENPVDEFIFATEYLGE